MKGEEGTLERWHESFNTNNSALFIFSPPYHIYPRKCSSAKHIQDNVQETIVYCKVGHRGAISKTRAFPANRVVDDSLMLCLCGFNQVSPITVLHLLSRKEEIL